MQKVNHENKPNFLIIGAARSGTTSLAKYIEMHPDIYISQIKEINYFSNEKIYTNGEKWYFKNFPTVKKMIGEASTSYSVAPSKKDVPRKIYQLLGPLKLIYIIRDPIDRLVSHYMHHVHRGEIDKPLSAIINSPDDPILIQGKYAFQLEQYLKYYKKPDILVLTISELKQQPIKTLKKIYSHLGVSASALTNIDYAPHNNSKNSTQKSKFGKFILNVYHKYIEQKNIPYPLKKIFLNLAEINSSMLEHPNITKQEYGRLIEYYKADVAKLTKQYNIDVSEWRNYNELN